MTTSKPKLTGPVSAPGVSARPVESAVVEPASGAAAAVDDTVKELPGIGPVGGVQYAGYASVYGAVNPRPGKADEGLFYWFVGADHDAEAPTVLWTNGGPGSSSFWGFFTENGPYEFDGAGQIQVSANAWNRKVNYLIFEHPLSVTLSFAADEADVPASVEIGIGQFYQALLHFLALHPELARRPLVLAGESYAGTYLPLLAQAILKGKANGGAALDLRGVVLLDAWVNPMVQMTHDTTYAFGRGLISAAQKRELDATYTGTKLAEVNEEIAKISGVYMANIAEQGDPPFEPVLAYLNRADVRAAIHAKAGPKLVQSWSEPVSNNYGAHVNDSYAPVVADLLGQGLPVLVMSGLNDAKDCNFLGTGAWLEELPGAAADAFRQAGTTAWTVAAGKDKEVLGYIQGAIRPAEHELLMWVKVLNAGHLAVRDQPRILDLIMATLLP